MTFSKKHEKPLQNGLLHFRRKKTTEKYLCGKIKPKQILGSKMVTNRDQSVLHFENRP